MLFWVKYEAIITLLSLYCKWAYEDDLAERMGLLEYKKGWSYKRFLEKDADKTVVQSSYSLKSVTSRLVDLIRF